VAIDEALVAMSAESFVDLEADEVLRTRLTNPLTLSVRDLPDFFTSSQWGETTRSGEALCREPILVAREKRTNYNARRRA
jgi:hypothetical protein